MNESAVLAIISLCRQIDEKARDLYVQFSQLHHGEQLKEFWLRMSKEESDHVTFWESAERLDMLPENVFIDPDTAIEELEYAIEKTDELLQQCHDSFSVANTFILAYRMEFYLLHPAFEILFELLGPVTGVKNPAHDYDSHLAGFIDTFAQVGSVTPELELLGETLRRLWKENRALSHQATRDDLTGVLNRRGFFAAATQLACFAQRNRSTVGVLMIDVDHFKGINERLGHWGGDLVLKEVAGIILRSLRSSDLMGRYGGEEFIVLLPATGTSMTATVAEKIRASLEAATLEGITLTLSVGFTEGTIGITIQEDLQSLIQHADAALFEAKKRGRNRVVKYDGTFRTPIYSSTSTR